MTRDELMHTNIILNENAAFGETNYEIVRLLLQMVDVNMMTALELPFFSSKQCIIIPTDDDPMCARVGEQHIIFLNTTNNHWCQWVYQFAHEYCHHLIDGSLSGEWSDMLWFEEAICELSSLYNLNRMIGFCMMNGLQGFAPSVEKYLNNLLTKNRNAYHLSANVVWYELYKDSLVKIQYQRDLYNAIAVLMYPLFMENPHLWKMILNIGDIRSWTSLDNLFSHLAANADESYRDSLKQLRLMFN